jgi:hypothetical protein
MIILSLKYAISILHFQVCYLGSNNNYFISQNSIQPLKKNKKFIWPDNMLKTYLAMMIDCVHMISISVLHLNVGAYFTALKVYMQVLEFCKFCEF